MTDVRGARIVRLIEDPMVGGDLLLVAVGLAAKYDFGLKYRQEDPSLAGLLWPDRQQHLAATEVCGVRTSDASMASWKIRNVFRRDIRTYEAPWPRSHRCTAPMVRRDGECGKSAALSGMLTDWATGEKRYVGGCRRHREWADEVLRDNRAQKPDLVPLPCANHGGALRPHFPRLDWRGFWRRLDPHWVEHPEAHAWPKPDLQLVLGGDMNGGMASGRPPLSVVPLGGGR